MAVEDRKVVIPVDAPSAGVSGDPQHLEESAVLHVFRSCCPCFEVPTAQGSSQREGSFRENTTSATCRLASMASDAERGAEIIRESKSFTLATEHITIANQELSLRPDLAIPCLCQAAKLHYRLAAETLTTWVNERKVSKEQVELCFSFIKELLDEYRYKSAEAQAAQILELAKFIGNECPGYSSIEGDICTLINCVYNLLKDLKINYHNIQHTLEVTLGTIQAISQCVEEGKTRNPKKALLPVVAALFHDIAYSNEQSIVACIRGLLEEQYVDLFRRAKGEKFVEEFQEQVREMEGRVLTGAELHKYHVQLSQVLLPLILKVIPDESLPHKEFLLQPDSLEKINAMISLTDIKIDSAKYKEGRREYLDQHDLLLAGDSLVTSDLLTQLSTSDRLSKGLALYHEFFLGQDAKFWHSGLALMSTATGFYENVAKRRFSPQVLAVLDRYFESLGKGANPYREGNELIFFLHTLFEPLYQKLTSGESILAEDILILRGLQTNGLQQEVVDLFLATGALRRNQPLPEGLSLEALLEDKGSLLEISLGDEVRITMMLGAASCDEMIPYLDLYRPEILIARAPDFIAALKRMGSHPDKNTLLEAVTNTVQRIPEDIKGLVELKASLAQI